MWRNSCILVVLAALNLSNCYKLLVVFPFPSKSHSILGEGYVKFLLQDGHEITYITPFPLKDPHPNLHQIEVSSLLNHTKPKDLTLENLLDKQYEGRKLSLAFFAMMGFASKAILHDNVQKLLEDTNIEFDAVIAEWMFSELYSGFAAVYNCPLIWSASMDPHWLDLRLIDEPVNPAYNAYELMDAAVPFSFWQRVYELVEQAKTYFFRTWVIGPKEYAIYEKAYKAAAEKRNGFLQPFENVKFNASLMLGNSHPSIGDAIRLPQNYKAIGGYHIFGSDVLPMPENFQKIMDESKHGVIYFSLGTLVEFKEMPKYIKANIINMFGNLKQTIIWKLDEIPSNLPSNVHVTQWAPQQRILAHPNTVLFITHGGILSIIEAVHYGVPMIGIPAFGDQHMNVAKITRKGIALEVFLTSKLNVDLKEAIEKILNNRSYSDKAKELSAIYHDRPVSPGAELVHWVRHVVRTHGAPHLRSPALMVPWYQKMYLDLLAIVIITFFSVIFILKRVMKTKLAVSHIKKSS